VLRRVRRAAPDVDVLIVDDNSTDRTAATAHAIGRELGRITLLRRPAKAGLGAAYRAGFDVIPQSSTSSATDELGASAQDHTSRTLTSASLRHPRGRDVAATMNDGRLDVQGGGPLQPGDIILMHFRPDLRQNLRSRSTLPAAAFTRSTEYLTAA
jgi:glycosyltransferase involved in cell wall biosynthesis